MRDDLHKSAPVGQKWKNFLKSCNTEAEQGDVAERRCRHAVVADCHREVARKFLTELTRIANESDGLLGAKLSFVRSSLDLGGSGTVFEEQILTRARMADRGTGFDAAAYESAIAGAIADRMDAQVRAVHGHVMRAEGRDKHFCLTEIRRSAAAVSPREIARELVANEGRIADSRRAVPAVSLDEVIPDRK